MNISWRKSHKKKQAHLKNEFAEMFRITKIGVLRHNVTMKPYLYNVE
ncbi:MAG: hypothetical protein U9N46_07355 [Euryarchaeota archaeon]|nr:hypothetical protein [Euryarchaeota archaeon]